MGSVFDEVPISSSDSQDLDIIADFRYSFTDIANALNTLKDLDP